MSASTNPYRGTNYTFESRMDFTNDSGDRLAYTPAEGLCRTHCPDSTAHCGIMALILRGEEQYGESVDIFGVVTGERGGTELEGEVYLETMVNPLTDDVHIDFAPANVAIIPEDILKLFSDPPEKLASRLAGMFVYPGNCLLDAIDSDSSTIS